MKERLKQLRKAIGLNQQEFAEKLKIGRSTIANYEAGTREPIEAVISLICKTWNVNENWLRTGEGEMFIEADQKDEIQRMVDEMLANDSADLKRRLVAAILRLSPEQIRAGVEWIKATFDLVESSAADEEAEIEEKVDSYRHELEAEAASGKSGASRTGSEKEA